MKKIRTPIFFILVLFFCITNIFGEGVTNPKLIGKDCTSSKPSDYVDAKEINIEYAGRDNATYSRAKPGKIQAIVFHDPGDNNCNGIERLVVYGQQSNPRPECGGGSCGYHFYIGTNGRIIQAAPMTVRTNHMAGYNSTSIGITLVCAGPKTNLPEKQVENSVLLSEVLRVAYGFSQIAPHNKAPREGIYISSVARARTVSQNQKYIIKYSLGDGSSLYCKVDGLLPPCTGNCSTGSLPSKNYGNLGTPPPFSSPYTDGKGNFIGDSKEWDYPFMSRNQPEQAQPLQSLNASPLSRLLSPSPQAQVQPRIIAATTTERANINNFCTNTQMVNLKLKIEYYLGLYNKNYLQKYGAWDKFLKGSSQLGFSFDNFFARFYAKQVETNVIELQKCFPEQ